MGTASGMGVARGRSRKGAGRWDRRQKAEPQVGRGAEGRAAGCAGEGDWGGTGGEQKANL